MTAPTCTGGNAGDERDDSPSFDPENITANWIGDLGNPPPTQTSYQVVAAVGAQFDTVVDEVLATANCGGVNVTVDGPHCPCGGRTAVSPGLPAVGQTLTSSFDVWPGNPAVGRQWKRCDAAGANCSNIPGATGSSYVLTDADIGRTIRVDESATEAALTSTVNGRTTPIPVFIPAMAPGPVARTG